jgi:hypothetical protein
MPAPAQKSRPLKDRINAHPSRSVRQCNDLLNGCLLRHWRKRAGIV